MFAMKKVWLYIKNYWWIPAIIIAIGVVYFFTQKSPDTLISMLRNAQETNEKEVKKLEEIHSEEILKREDALRMYHLTLEQLEDKYAAQEEKLDRKKKKEIKKIIEESNGDPQEIAKKLSQITGFEIVYSKEEK